MIQRAPGSIRTTRAGRDGRTIASTALQVACECCPHLELGSTLIDAYPAAAQDANARSGKLPPPHAAVRCINPRILDVIRRLSNELPQVLRARNNDGMAPLMHAIEFAALRGFGSECRSKLCSSWS
jgi:hypothetical protein